MYLVNGKRRHCSTADPAELKVALNVPNMMRVSFDDLLHHSVGEQLERVDEAFLCCGCNSADGIQPEPMPEARERQRLREVVKTYDRVISPPTHSPSGRGL